MIIDTHVYIRIVICTQLKSMSSMNVVILLNQLVLSPHLHGILIRGRTAPARSRHWVLWMFQYLILSCAGLLSVFALSSSCLLESVLCCCCFLLSTEFHGLCSRCHSHIAPLWRVWRWSFWYCVLLRQEVTDKCAHLFVFSPYLSILRMVSLGVWSKWPLWSHYPHFLAG